MEARTGCALDDPRELWREWYPRARAYCRAFARLSESAREEIASDAVLHAYLARDRFRRGSPFSPWFFTILRRLALDAADRARRHPSAEEPAEEAASPHQEGPELLEREEEEAFVRSFLEGRPALDRELASLVHGQGLSLSEAARVVDLPLGTVKWRMSRLREELRAAWERTYG